jgi:AcrR family transcriptional regulator
MDAIISRAQMSKRTAYAFGNKAALLEAVIAAHILDQFTPIEALQLRGLPPKDFLLAIGEAFLTAASDPMTQQIDHLLIGEARLFPELADRFHSEGLGRAKALVRATFATLGVGDPDMACDAFYALLVLQPLRSSTGGRPKSDQYARDVVNYILR